MDGHQEELGLNSHVPVMGFKSFQMINENDTLILQIVKEVNYI